MQGLAGWFGVPVEGGTVLALVRLNALAPKGDCRRASEGLTLPSDPGTLAQLKKTTNKKARATHFPRKPSSRNALKPKSRSIHMRSLCKALLSFAQEARIGQDIA